MNWQASNNLLDTLGILPPVQWCFKGLNPDGTRNELLLRRVKQGNEAEVEEKDHTEFETHYKGKFSHAASLCEHIHDRYAERVLGEWGEGVTYSLLEQMVEVARHQAALLELFIPKGKIEIYAPEFRYFQPQYIAANYTLKLHADDMLKHKRGNLFSRLIAQHLDYPYAPGERRFSTSKLFDLCFAAEKLIAPKGLAAHIDTSLEKAGMYQSARHETDELEQVRALLGGAPASIANSYTRVLQRERFAHLVEALYTASSVAKKKSPILTHYKQLIEVDLLSHKQRQYKDYPSKTVDEMAEALHVPLMIIFEAGRHERITDNTG